MDDATPQPLVANRRPFGAIWPRRPSSACSSGSPSPSAVIYCLDRTGSFFSAYSRQTLLHQVALFGVLSVGAAVVIIAGGIDLSIGAVVALSSIVCAKLLTAWLRGGDVRDRRRRRPPIVALAIGLTLAAGPGHRPAARPDDQPASGCRRSSPRWRRWRACGAWRRS